MERAIFKYNDGSTALLCNECRAIIKTSKDFDDLERIASTGVVTLLAQYCKDHKYLGLHGLEKEIEMKRMGIKTKLREAIMNKNILDITITRPTQELIIMRGIPGSGKSTLAKSLVGEGAIHSTDNLIEATGNYSEFFKKMSESKDFSALGKVHFLNFLNAKKSMYEGVSPVIIDNTNIKAVDAKKYVVEALKLGLDDENIKIVDVGSGNVTAKVLSERNTHGVPFKKISSLISSHKSIGKLTVEKILEAKSRDKVGKVLYAGVILSDESKSKLLSLVEDYIPDGWVKYAHHMTISFGGPLTNRAEIGKPVQLRATAIGKSDMAIAVKVEGYPSNNDIPHITVAVNVAEGGKPFMSNKITDWSPLDGIIRLSGTVKEVTT